MRGENTNLRNIWKWGRKVMPAVIRLVKRRPRSIIDWLQGIKAELPPNFLEDLSQGRFPVHEEHIMTHLSKAIKQSATLRTSKCRPDGLYLELITRATSLRPALKYSARIVVQEFHMSASVQEMTFDVLDENLEGRSLLGSILAPVIQSVLVAIYGNVLAAGIPSKDSGSIHITAVKTTESRFVADLSGLAIVEKLRNPVVMGRSVLDLIELTDCTHADGRLLLKGGISPTAG